MRTDGNYQHGLTKTRPYRIWKGMRQRCNNIKNKNYKNWGGRGISICKEWNDPKIFCKWAEENGHSEELTLDRINNDGNYEPTNCKWSTQQEQVNNSRRLNSRNTSGYRGVSFDPKRKDNKHYTSSLRNQGILIYLGHFTTALEAALERDRYILIKKLTHKRNFDG